jgi:tetratricopeptide (TPR) repeat protein
MIRRSLLVALVLALNLPVGSGCIRDGASRSPDGADSWYAWQDLSPLFELAGSHVSEATKAAFKDARKALGEGNPAAAYTALLPAKGHDPHWVSVARANLAALNFSVCIRGVAWRLPTAPTETRDIDFSPDTELLPGDVGIEALLSDLDEAGAFALKHGAQSLGDQVRVARARVTTYVAECPANADVQDRAVSVMRDDLAALAAENALTPDLSYMWGAIQFEEYSPAAARPFFAAAIDAGFADPSVVLTLATVELTMGRHTKAVELAERARVDLEERGDPIGLARAWVILGDAKAMAEGEGRDAGAARAHYESALEIEPSLAQAVVGLARLESRQDRIAGVKRIHGSFATLIGDIDDPKSLVQASSKLESLVLAVNEEPDLAELCRDALVHDVDEEENPIARGLRYYYAATLDAALGDYASARGRAAVSESEFELAGIEAPPGVSALLQRLAELGG